MKSINEKVEDRGYKTYRALLTQSSTSAPVATVIENSIGTLVWAYSSTGVYTATLVGAFTNATTVLISNDDIDGIAGAVKTSADVVTVTTGTAATTAANGILDGATIEIKVEL